MAYPLNTPFGRFGIETVDASPERCVATIPLQGLQNPLTGAATIAPLALLVDHVGGMVNHLRRDPDRWTVTSELAVEMAADAADHLGQGESSVTCDCRPVGRIGSSALAWCELSAAGHIVGTATVRSFFIEVPAEVAFWPDEPDATLPGPALADLMAVDIPDQPDEAAVLLQRDDPVLSNAIGMVHGGISSMGLELVGSAALHPHAESTPLHTGSLRVNYLRPFRGGTDARYEARPLHLGRRSGVAEAQALCPDGRVAQYCRVTAYR